MTAFASAMDEQEYHDLKRYIAWVPQEKKDSRPVGRPKGSKDKKKRKPRKKYPRTYDMFADEPLDDPQ